MLTTRVEEAIETLQNRMEEIKQASNLFISKNDIRLVTSQASELNNKLKVVLAKAKNL
jgi:prefoldin subunit 5